MSGFRVLGALEAWAGDRRLALAGPRQVALLAYLLVHANHAVSADALIDALWGSERDGATKRLQMAIARLRKTLGPLAADEGVIGLAAVAAVQHRDELAAELQGAARACGYPETTIDRAIDDRLERDYFAAARKRYGTAAWQRAEQGGARLPHAEAIERALRQSELAARPFANLAGEGNHRPQVSARQRYVS